MSNLAQSIPISNRPNRSIPTHSYRIVEFKDQHAPSPPESQIRKTEEAVANAGGATTIPNDAERWAKVQTGQFSKPVDTFEWAEVPLDQYSNTGKKSS